MQFGGQVSRKKAFIHEHFADLYATYFLGPAYACTCILRRFDPVGAHHDQVAHPSADSRVYLILRFLERLADGVPQVPGMGHEIRHFSRTLGEIWKRQLQEYALPAEQIQTQRTRFEGLPGEVYKILSNWCHLPYREKEFRQDYRLAEQWLSEMRTGDLLSISDYGREFWGGRQIISALNAAWIYRLRLWPDDFAYRKESLNDFIGQTHKLLNHIANLSESLRPVRPGDKASR